MSNSLMGPSERWPLLCFSTRYDKNLVKGAFFSLLLVVFILTPQHIGQASSLPSSNFLDVSYHAQETDYYCAPACVEMVIQYVSGKQVSTDVLANEMKTNVNGTDPSMIHVPFENRGFTLVGETHATRDELKEENLHGYALIASIWFDTDHKLGHYVVIVGYNLTGIFVNDPWPKDWIQPKSRDTGKNAFIPNLLFTDLWQITYQWMLDVSYPMYNRSLPTTPSVSLPLLMILVLGLFVSAVFVGRRWKHDRLSV